MKPIFTIHEGEFLVGDHISRKLKDQYDVYIPVKDRGIDLLLNHKSKRKRRPPISLQVKFSRSYGSRNKTEGQHFRARGWFTLKPTKIRESPADIWVFAIMTLRHRSFYIVVPTSELRKRIPRPSPKIWHLYLTIYEINKSLRCYDTRGLNDANVGQLLETGRTDRKRDYNVYLNDWRWLERSG